jgi:tetratricopeptide (TPR) repeat protein
MKQRVLVILAVLVVLLLAGVAGLLYSGHRAAGRLAVQHRRELTSPEARVRLAAARALLARDSHDHDAALAGAQALIELGNYGEVRDLLRGLIYEGPADHIRALELEGQVCIGQAAQLAADPAPGAIDVVADKVRALVKELDAVRAELAQVAGGGPTAALLEAGGLDVQADLCRQQARDPNSQMARAEVLGTSDVSLPAHARIIELQSDLRRLHKPLEALCAQLLRDDPNCARARTLRFKLHEREGDGAAARADAQALLALPRIPRDDAGQVAGALLNLEMGYARYASAADLALAQRLLTAPNLEPGTSTLAFDLARADAALARGQPAEARRLAEEGLRDYEDNQGLVCALGRAFVAEGQAGAAIDLLRRFEQRSDRVALPAEAYVLGLAYLADGQVVRGRDALRHALDLAPDLLPARLALAQSLLEEHAASSAEADILVAVRLCPDHPVVRALQARLVVETADDGRLADLVAGAQKGRPGGRGWRPEDLVLVADLVLDDVDGVAGTITQGLAADPADALLLLADAWRRLKPEFRARVAAGVAQAMLDSLDTDPLQHPGPPVVPSLHRVIRPLVAAGSQPAVDLDPLTVRHFVPAAEETALALMQAGLERWPKDRQLVGRAATLCLVLDRPAEAAGWAAGARAAAATTGAGPALWPQGSWPAVLADLRGNPAAPAILAEWAETAGAVRDQDPRAPALLEEYLRRHPWAEQLMLLAVRQSLEKHDPDGAARWIALALPTQPDLATLVRARLDLALGQPAFALKGLGSARHGTGRTAGPGDSASEVRAYAHLLLGEVAGAEDPFDDTAMLHGEARTAMYLRWADVLLEAGQATSAIATLKTPLAEGSVSPRGMDQLLGRCLALMAPAQFQGLLTELLAATPGDPLLLLYQAQAAEGQGSLAEAEDLVGRALKMAPDAPRGWMMQARLAARQGRGAEARAIYQQLLGRGGGVAAAAAAELQRLDRKPAAGPARSEGTE